MAKGSWASGHWRVEGRPCRAGSPPTGPRQHYPECGQRGGRSWRGTGRPREAPHPGPGTPGGRRGLSGQELVGTKVLCVQREVCPGLGFAGNGSRHVRGTQGLTPPDDLLPGHGADKSFRHRWGDCGSARRLEPSGGARALASALRVLPMTWGAPLPCVLGAGGVKSEGRSPTSSCVRGDV